MHSFSWARACRVLAITLLLVTWAALPAGAAAASTGADFPVTNGHFYSQANGQGGGAGQPGFIIEDDNIPFWSTFSRQGGVPTFGYPISSRFQLGGFTDQAMQKSIFQWTGHGVAYLNVLDLLHDANMDAWLQANYFTPPPLDTAADTGLSWSQVVARHQSFLDGNAAIRAAYFAALDPIALYGLPVTTPTPEANAVVIVVRPQRAVLQQWLTPQPWAAAGQVTIANGGDIAKAAGILPAAALVPQLPASSVATTGTTTTAAVPYPVTSSTSDN